MILYLYTNESDRHHVTKTLTTLYTLNDCDLKEDSSLENPRFILAGSIDHFSSVNYVYAPSLGRYYYVEGMETYGNGMTILSCHVDVLMSFSGEFLECEGIIERNQNFFNLSLDDSEFRLYSDPIIVTKNFSSGFSSPCYVLMAAGRGTPATP